MNHINNKDNENLNIFYTKLNGYDIAFDKNYLQEFLEKLKTKKLAIIDFEAFRVYDNEIDKFTLVKNYEYFKKIKTFPFCFTFATFYIGKKGKFKINEKSITYYKINSKRNIDNEYLKKEWVKMGEKIKEISKKWEIDGFIVMGNLLEKNIINFLNESFKKKDYKIPLIEIDLWNFFAKRKKFSILSYNFRLRNLINYFQNNISKDPIKSEDIGKITHKYFLTKSNLKNDEIKLFKDIKNHNKIDIEKAIWTMNLMIKLNNQKNINNPKKIIKNDEQEIKLF